MYIRTTTRKNKDGSVVRYVQLAHNVWDPKATCSKTEVIRNLGREEDLDRKGLQRLVETAFVKIDIHAACGGTNEERKWALANYSF
jgi:hypothetical protein